MTAGGARTGRLVPWWLPPVAAAFAVRVLAGLLLPAGERGPRGFDFYGYMADHVLSGRGLCWSFYDGLGWKYANRGPLYPLLVAGVRWFGGSPAQAAVVVAQSLVGAAATGAAALLASRWGGRRAALLCLWIAALWPWSVSQDTALVEHVVHAPLVALSAWAAMRVADGGPRPDRRAFAAGALAALATLARLTSSLSAPFLAFAAARGPRVGLLLAFAAGFAGAAAPWVVRNHAATGHAVLGTDGGRALWVGTAPETFLHYPARSVDEGERELFRRLGPGGMAELRALGRDEVAQDARFREMALANVAADPAGAAGRAFRKAAALWSLVMNPGPSPGAKIALHAVTLGALLVGAAAAAATCARVRADLPTVLAIAASFTLSAMLFWGQSKYLAPAHGIGLAMTSAWIARRPETRP